MFYHSFGVFFIKNLCPTFAYGGVGSVFAWFGNPGLQIKKTMYPIENYLKPLYSKSPYTSFFLPMGMPTGSPLQLVAFLIIMLGVQR
jgi:hypothetical protein